MFPTSSYSSSEMQGVCAQSFAPFQPFSLMFGVSKRHRLPSIGTAILNKESGVERLKYGV